MTNRVDLFTTLIILAVAVWYTVTALQFPGSARIVPAIFGGVAILLLVIQLLGPRISALRALSGEFKDEDDSDLAVLREPSAQMRFLIIGGSLLAVPLLIAVVGLPLTLPLYVAALLLIQRQRLSVVIAVTALVLAMSYGLLVRLIAWPLNDGALWSLLR